MAGHLKIDWQPIDAPAVCEPELASTWASLRIDVLTDDGHSVCLTRVLDRHARTERSQVWGTVMPLAGWIARCWHHLVTAHRSPPPFTAHRRELYEWRRTHRWRYSGEGAALPDLEFLPVDQDFVQLRCTGSAGDDTDQYERVLFLSSGRLTIPAVELQRTLEEFVDSVLARVHALVPDGERTIELRRYWQAARDPSDPDYSASRLAARLGLHWWVLDADTKARLRMLSRQPRDPIAESSFELTSLADLQPWLNETARIWQMCEEAPAPSADWISLRTTLASHSPTSVAQSPPPQLPWRRGWQAARDLRGALRLAEDAVPDLVKLYGRLQPACARMSHPAVKSVVGWAQGRGPVVATARHEQDPGGRFAQARDLYPMLFAGRTDRAFACVLSDRIAGLRSVANAFAAEMLAPVQKVKDLLAGRGRVDGEGLDEIAVRLGAPEYCVRHQVENHRLAEVVDG